MIAACKLFVSFFAAVTIVLIAHHLYAFFLRKQLNRRTGGTDMFGEHYEKALHDVVFDNVFISAEAKRRRELSGISNRLASRAESRGDASLFVPNVLPEAAAGKKIYSGISRPSIRLISKGSRRQKS
jgi:hypothetical protein